MWKEKNEIYILNQPKRLLLSIIVVDLPLSKALEEKIHFNLGWLVDYSDLFFIFSESHFPEQNRVDKMKFTSLYGGCGYIENTKDSISSNLVKILLYDKEILGDTQNHLGISVSRLSDISELATHQFSSIQSIMGSSITRPIYTVRRLSSSELFNIYSLNKIEPENSVQELTGRGIFKTIMRALRVRKKLGNKIGMYSTWHSESPIMYFPKSAIESILRHRDLGKNEFEEWSETFITSDPRYYLASLVNNCGLEILNMEVENVKV